MKTQKTRYYRVQPTQSNTDNLRLQPWYGDPRYAEVKVVMEYDHEKYSGRVLQAEVIAKPDPKTFKCVLERTQYQVVEFEAETHADAREIARDLFDETKELNGMVRVYDLKEVRK